MDWNSLRAYELVREEELHDIGSKGILLRHRKTGARVLCIECEDENKVFNIAFRTPPVDSTGVAHIIEHTVLCGSRKFPSKDPFVELVKGSMNTFLNAMTFSDKTMFPLASCNDQDFRNLCDVYLDAVFYPNIYQKEEIFRQEGWNMQLENPEDEIVYNGVVYNEMKGAYSSPDEVLERQIMQSLFPDTTYGVESGGDPEHIPELTYEQFLDFHRAYYHPSNSYIYLYGNMDFEERLAFLDREYLSHFDFCPVKSEISLQAPFQEPTEISIRYPVAQGDPLEDNTYFSWNAVIGESGDSRLANSFAALEYVLLEAPGAPLKKALIDAGIGKDVYGSYDSSIRQPVFSVIAKGANLEDAERFRRIVRGTLEKLASEGLNPKEIEAAVNSMEFKFREADFGGYPKGLIYGIDAMDSWLYDDNEPFSYLIQEEDFRFLREKIGSSYYEDLIRTCLLENPHTSYVTAEPARGMTSEMEELTRKKLSDYKASLNRDQIAELIRKTQNLRLFQETPSSQEELEKIPMLKREDLRRETRGVKNEVLEQEGVKLVCHDYQTNGIAYIQLLFDVSGLLAEELPYFGILKAVLGDVDTENYSYSELATEIGRRTGGIQTGISVYPNMERSDSLKAALALQISTLPGEIDFSIDIAREILLNSKFDDDKRLGEIIRKLKSRTGSQLIQAGHLTAVHRCLSYFSAEEAFTDGIAGVSFYQKLLEIEGDFEGRKEELKEHLRSMLRKIAVRENLCVSFTGDRELALRVLDKALSAFPGETGKGGIFGEITDLPCSIKNEAFLTPAKVSYVAEGGNFREEGFAYTGALSVLKVIMNYDYLWQNLRVIGGAYGCGASFARNGSAIFYSYRDPHIKNTLKVYEGIPAYLRSFTADEREMTKYVIGTISDFDVPLTPRMAGNRSMSLYMNGISREKLQKERDQVLDCSVEDIRALAPMMEAVLSKNALCVVGGEDKIRSEKELFKNLLPLS